MVFNWKKGRWRLPWGPGPGAPGSCDQVMRRVPSTPGVTAPRLQGQEAAPRAYSQVTCQVYERTSSLLSPASFSGLSGTLKATPCSLTKLCDSLGLSFLKQKCRTSYELA